MGYLSRITGRITLDPPVTYAVLRDSRFYTDSKTFKPDARNGEFKTEKALLVWQHSNEPVDTSVL